MQVGVRVVGMEIERQAESGDRGDVFLPLGVQAADLRPGLEIRAIGFDDRIGSIEPGKQADLVCVDLSALETQPLHHVVSQLIYATGRQQVSDVWIAGKAKLRQLRANG